jgi:hypothetical protein
MVGELDLLISNERHTTETDYRVILARTNIGRKEAGEKDFGTFTNVKVFKVLFGSNHFIGQNFVVKELFVR